MLFANYYLGKLHHYSTISAKASSALFLNVIVVLSDMHIPKLSCV